MNVISKDKRKIYKYKYHSAGFTSRNSKAVTSYFQHNGPDAFEVYVAYGTPRPGISHYVALLSKKAGKDEGVNSVLHCSQPNDPGEH